MFDFIRKLFKKDGWTVEISPEVEKQLEDDPELKEALEDFKTKVESGEIDPIKEGTKICGYCGRELPNDYHEQICSDCQSKLR